MKYIYFSTLCVFVFLFQVAAQVSGTWMGNYGKTLLSFNPQSLVVELSLYNDTMITGASHLYYNNGKFEHHKLTGKYNPKDSSINFYESMLETNLGLGAIDVSYKVKMKPNGDRWVLEGHWKNVKGIFGYMPFNTVFLERPRELPTAGTTLKTGNPDLNADSILLSRASDIQKVIEVLPAEKDSIKLSIYDNGEIDNDTISVYVNDRIVLSRQVISDKPILFYMSLDTAVQFQKVKMVAENLGTIPPNTAVMIIETSKNRHEVRMKSDLEKNAVVEFVLLK
jgi:hypothetical protein